MDNFVDCERGVCGHDHQLEALRDAEMAKRLKVHYTEVLDEQITPVYYPTPSGNDIYEAFARGIASVRPGVLSALERMSEEDKRRAKVLFQNTPCPGNCGRPLEHHCKSCGSCGCDGR